LGTSSDTKELVRQASDIVDVVGRYLDLRREGRSYKALCPWHNDSRPSLHVNPERQIFRCFVCNIGGDVFDFVMRMEGVGFAEALRNLADRAGIQISARGPTKEQLDEKQRLYAAMAWAQLQYHQFLLTEPEGEIGRKYLQARGISEDTIKRFHLGLAPDRWDWISQKARAQQISLETLLAVGVLGKSNDGRRTYDRFKGRVLFPICDPQGRPVGLGGRVLPELDPGNTAKYINSPETPLFSKSKLLYGLDHAREAISSSRTALIVEGYTDCLIAHQLGISNVVAVLGTALGEAHLRTLRPYADRIVLVLDGDEAGRKRANEVLELFVAQQVDLKILTLPDELDPCDYLLQYGASEFRRLLAGAADALEHKFQQASQTAQGMYGENRAIEEVLATLAKIPVLSDLTTSAAKLKESQVLSRLATRFGVDETVLRERLKKLRRGKRSASEQAGAASPAARFAEHAPLAREPGAKGERLSGPQPAPAIWERELLELVLLAGDLVGEVAQVVTPDDFASPICREVFVASQRQWEAGQPPTFEQLMLQLEEPAIRSWLVELDDAGRQKRQGKCRADLEQELGDVLSTLRRRRAKQDSKRAAALLRQGQLPEDRGAQVLDRIIQQQRLRQGIAEPMEG
jgi:DNA primase